MSEFPSTYEMLKNLLESGHDIIQGVVQGDAVFADDVTYERRLSICNTCEFFVKESQRCAKCGCYMTKKSAFKNLKCPLNKW